MHYAGMAHHHHHDLLQHVLTLTYRRLLEDAGEHAGQRTTQRFTTPGAHHKTRELILSLCRDHDADSEFTEFVSGHWLGRFAPLLM